MPWTYMVAWFIGDLTNVKNMPWTYMVAWFIGDLTNVKSCHGHTWWHGSLVI